MDKNVDLVVIGAGPGGYPAAIRAAQLGLKVVIVDKGSVGGECLNWGCIPSKALISASEFYYHAKNNASDMGINITDISVDLNKLMSWKESIQNKLISGIHQLFKVNKIDLIIGNAKFLNNNELKVITSDGEEKIIFKNAIIATGSTFISIPQFKIDGELIISAKDALSLKEIPENLVCIGGGIIGLELGTVWAKLGSKVTIVELLPNLMTGVEKRLVNMVKKKLKKLGVDIYTESKALETIKIDNKTYLKVETKKGIIEIPADKILLSIGKKASTHDIGIDNTEIELDSHGFIKTDDQMRTNIKHIYAVGDVTGPPFLAHRATKQGIVAAEACVGLSSKFDYKSITSAIFTDPEIGFVGMSESEAKKNGYNTIVGQASFAVSGRALSHQAPEGIVRIIADSDTKKILGIEIAGVNASDMISEAALAIEMGGTAEDIAHAIHPHPTLPELIMEAAESIEGKAIHVPNARIKKKVKSE